MQEAAMSEQIILEIFSDYVCPFCRLAESAIRELEQNEL
jgi:predicted DsbA family dithiol-disulfide isomerase